MADSALPFSHSFDLASLGENEKVVELKPSTRDRMAIAQWAGLEALDSFAATIRLRRAGDDRYEYEGSFAADVTQACVVTLVPVQAHLEGTVSRALRVVAQRGRRRVQEEEPETAGEDEIDTLPSGVLNLAAPVLEEFALAIDPYPRAPGAVFEPLPDPDKPANPFGALEKLKGKG